MMSKNELRRSHQRQIEALLSGDYHDFMRETDSGNVFSHHDAWNETGGCENSLFSRLPDCSSCLTQIKSGAYKFDRVAENFYHKLELKSNDLIPTLVDEDCQLTREELEEFSRLQIKARFPDAG